MSTEIEKSEEILKSAGIINEVKEKENVLIPIAKYVIKSKTMDKNTIIYRLAMMIYHSRTNAGADIIEAIGDPGSIYLRLMENSKIEALFNKLLSESPFLPAIELTKTFICFVIGAYLYSKASSQSE